MKKITFFSMLFLLLCSSIHSQCIRTAQQSPVHVSNNSGLQQMLVSCANTNQFAIINGLIVGQSYKFTCSDASSFAEKYITVTTTDNTVIAHGPSPLTLTATTESIRAHYSFNSTCDIGSGCNRTAIQLLPTCPLPTNAGNVSLSSTAAGFTWIAGSLETAWDVLVLPAANPAPTAATTEDVIQVTTPSFTTATPLLPGTNYKFYVRAVCAGPDSSPWFSIAFTTLCESNDWFYENFDAAATLPTCWRKVGNTGFVNIQNSTLTASPPRALYIASDNGTDKGVLALPPVNNPGAGTHRLKFSTYSIAAGQIFEIGYLTNVLDPSSFVYLGQFLTTTTNQNVTFTPEGMWSGIVSIRTGPAASSAFIDNFTWELVPDCDDVSNIAISEIQDTTATVTWLAGGQESGWDVAYGLSTVNNPNTLTPLEVTELEISIPVLQNSSYKLWIRSKCDEGSLGAWIGPKTFTTQCSQVSTYSQNFVGLNALPSCWSKVGTGGSASVFSSYLSLFSSAGSVAIVTTAPVNNADAASHRLRIKASQSSGAIEAGFLTDVTNPQSFVMVGTFPAGINGTDILTYSVDYPSFATQYIALRRPGLMGANIYEVNWEPIPTCGDVTGFAVTDLTSNEAVIEWSLPGNGPTDATAWEVVYGSASVTDPATLTIIPVTNSITFLDVEPLTSYKAWVRSVCGINDKGVWIGPINFTTPCVEVSTISQNFDAATTFPDCWSKVGTGGTILIQATPNAFTSPNALFMLSSTASSRAVVSLPPLSTILSNTHHLKFKARSAFAVGGVIELGYLNIAGDASSFTLIESFTTTSITAYEDFVAELPATIPTTAILAFRHDYSVPNAVLIDNVIWEDSLSNPHVNSNAFTAYPNPVEDYLNLSYFQTISEVTVFNLLGQKVIEKKVNADEVKMDMSALASGSYIVKVASSDQVKTIKIIKK